MAPDLHCPKIYGVEDYEPYIGKEAVDRILKKASAFSGKHVGHVNSTYYGGGVAEILLSYTLLSHAAGIKTGWRTIQGRPDFFSVTKKIHNALQGGGIDLSERKRRLFEETNVESSLRMHFDSHDYVFIHDPQPLPLIRCYAKKVPWIWRCHVDLSNPHPGLWKYLAGFIEDYDSVILSIPEYRQNLKTPQHIFMPAIDPFSVKNRQMNTKEIKERLDHYKIPTDLPIVTQISRFDRWKDPEGVIDAFRRARKEAPSTLVLLGNVAPDDPEGQEVFESLLDQREERILILSAEDTALVNALQSTAAVVLQKSIREGFGLTVTEAMWKGAAVIGGNVGGIRYQIEDGLNGFLVASPQQAAERIVQLVKDKDLRRSLGEKARETVKNKFLLTRLFEEELDLMAKLAKKS